MMSLAKLPANHTEMSPVRTTPIYWHIWPATQVNNMQNYSLGSREKSSHSWRQREGPRSVTEGWLCVSPIFLDQSNHVEITDWFGTPSSEGFEEVHEQRKKIPSPILIQFFQTILNGSEMMMVWFFFFNIGQKQNRMTRVHSSKDQIQLVIPPAS